MKYEKSCGAVIYDYDNNILKILLIKHNVGHWSSPKGHIENNETEEETALREIKEETNLIVELDTNFRKQITYSPKEGVIKDVVFFVAKAKTKDIIKQDAEVEEIGWFSKTESLAQVTFKEDKKVLQDAIKYIESKDR